MPEQQRNINARLTFAALALLVALTLVYWNHFDNTFHFDDIHTIVENSYITDIRNLPEFFTNPRTSSSLPTNQAYRPIIASLNAIDHWIGGGLNPRVFHWHIYIEFLLLLGLLYWLLLTVFEAASGKRHEYVALAGTALYGFHTATAETINYIIARSDEFSTLMVVLGMLLFIRNSGWRRQWALLPFVIGCLAKPTTLMLAPLLFVYVLIVEAPSVTVKGEAAGFVAKTLTAIRCTGSFFVLGAALYFFSRFMTPDTWTPGGGNVAQYLNTQAYVVWVYIKTFFLPTGLTADTDLALIRELFAPKVLWGLFVVAIFLLAALFAARRRITLPIAFGILWFFIALIPSSTVIPLAEVMNHHRTFFPYIGLVMAASWGAFLLLQRLPGGVASLRVRAAAGIGVVLLLAAHAFGTYQRNEVWDSGASLWHDVTIKSPGNGRGLMNYGLTRMRAGDIEGALEYFNRATTTKYGRHPYLFVNRGIATDRLGQQRGDPQLVQEAEQYFDTARQLGSEYPATHYRYAFWLHRNERSHEALPHVKKAVELAPAHRQARELLQQVLLTTRSDVELAETTAAQLNTAGGYANLSLYYYQLGLYTDSIDAANRALQRSPDYAIAHNNICAAYNRLEQYDDAVAACEQALAVNSDYELAAGNLAAAHEGRLRQRWLQQSLEHFEAGRHVDSLAAARSAVELDPEFAEGWNNICAAHNALADWDAAIVACERALELSPDYQLARNNLNWAREKKAATSQ